MELINNFGKESIPTIVKDPFNKNSIKRIYVSFSSGFSGDRWQANGAIEFSNGDTNGEQTFKGDSFDDVVIKMKAFMITLENKQQK